jgi:hypothetical protein
VLSGFGVSRDRTTWNLYPSNSRLPKHRREWISRHASSGWTAVIFPCTQYGRHPLRYLRRTFLFAISRQPLICSYGWIQTIDTIILPARLILSPKRTSSIRCAWALLVQPADLDIPMPKTSNVANMTSFDDLFTITTCAFWFHQNSLHTKFWNYS